MSVQYIIITGSATEVEAEINDWAKLGWRLVGPVAYSTGPLYIATLEKVENENSSQP